MREPKARGRYQYIRMELCELGDAEEFIKTLPDETLDPEVARKLLFQMAFALHIAAERFSLKHYDVKLLNYFIQTMKSDKSGDIVLRYGVGDLVFALRSPKSSAFLAKLADYGTANVDSATDGQQVTIAQFTTLENTPVDFLLLGDSACQGHGHDSFGLGLCMLHLYTGHAPYEEILEKVTCPPNLKERLRNLWECEDEEQYSVIRGVILSNVVKDEEGHILEGEPNDVLYDTLYRFLVLFGIPDLPAHLRTSKVWCVVRECLEGHGMPRSKAKRGKNACDVDQYIIDCRKYSIDRGTDKFIRRARVALETLDGGMDLLKSLVSFDPITRSTALDVMNSKFMEPLREAAGGILGYGPDDDLRTFSSFPTKNES
jgi:serine/threonine protein kinase